MAKNIIEQAEPHIGEIVRICRVLEAEGRELDELNDLVGRTIQNSLVRSNGGTDGPRPIDIKFKLLRRSGRQASLTKRSYGNMQNADSRASRLPKKQKLATDEPVTDESATDKPATNERATEPTTLESTGNPAITEPNKMESLRTSREDRSSDTGIVDNGMPDADKQRPFARCSILDGSVQWLEDVVVALKHVDDKSRTPDSSVSGILDDVLTTAIIRTNFVNIMSSVTEKWARCNRLIAKPHGACIGKTREEQAKSEERLRHTVA
ncbi:hypothetical protein BKA61DRAFT_675914 [Leptodontidium sp. MPI-SDFR-AT-0119]|nr:hypothetical protein BKA61DRAFT_675914 [Leptodontidium sp. MPI-SDFR-AT-0119]